MHSSCFIKTYYFLCVYIYIYDYGNDVRQTENLSDFSEFKMGCTAAEKPHNINNALGPGTANEHTVQW